jgi:hypothetical protein
MAIALAMIFVQAITVGFLRMSEKENEEVAPEIAEDGGVGIAVLRE